MNTPKTNLSAPYISRSIAVYGRKYTRGIRKYAKWNFTPHNITIRRILIRSICDQSIVAVCRIVENTKTNRQYGFRSVRMNTEIYSTVPYEVQIAIWSIIFSNVSPLYTNSVANVDTNSYHMNS